LTVHTVLAWFIVGLCLLTSSLNATAQTDAATAEALMRTSGMWKQLASIPPQVRAGFVQGAAQSGVKPSQAEIDRLSRIIDEAYASDRLRSTALASIVVNVKADHVPALKRWYSSPLGQRIAGLEEAAAATQTDPQAVVRQGMALLSAMDRPRRTLLEEIVVVTRSAETVVQITIDTTLAAQRGVLSVTPNAPRGSAQELKAALEAQRPQLLQLFSGFALASFAMAYETLSTAELAQYAEFLKSDPGRHFAEVGVKALSAALVEAAAELGRKLPGTSDKANS
jgi:hypothetical protein